MATERLYSGLVIRSHCVRDAQSKSDAWDSLYGWQSVELTAQGWVNELERGHTIQPSYFVSKTNGKYTHAEDNWVFTYLLCADADNIKGVEFKPRPVKDADGENVVEVDENGEVILYDTHPDGVPYWTELNQLSAFYPTLKDECYAVVQSVSSMSESKLPLHRRYRFIFLFDKPIKSGLHYRQILSTLAERYPIIDATERAPSQPVFGNARPDTCKAHIGGNILKLSDYPYVEPVETSAASGGRNGSGAGKSKWNATQRKYQHNLDGFISDAVLTTHETDSKGRVRVDCPFDASHKRDAFVALDSDGYPCFKCNHNSCSGNGFNELVRLKSIEVVPERRYDKPRVDESPDDLDLSPLPVTDAAVVPSFPDYEGETFLGAFQALYQAYADSHVWSPEMLMAMGIGSLSFIARGARVRTHERANSEALNSYVLAVGESDLTAKSKALSEIRKFMNQVDHDFDPVSNVQSIEGLLTALNDGDSPERYCLFDEGSVVFENTRRSGTKNLFSGLNELWLCPPTYATARAAGLSKVANPYVCAWANIPTKLIASVFRHEDMIGGSLNRWLPFFISPKVKTERYPHAEGHAYDVWIKELHRIADSSKERILTFTQDADDSRFAWYEGLRDKAIQSGEQIGESRFETHAVKLAGLFALAENPTIDCNVYPHQWDAALSVVRYLSACAEYLFRNVGASRLGELENDLLDVLAQHENEMTLNLLTRKTQRFDTEERAKILDLLETNRQIVRFTERTKGRPKVMVRRVS